MKKFGSGRPAVLSNIKTQSNDHTPLNYGYSIAEHTTKIHSIAAFVRGNIAFINTSISAGIQ